MPPPQYPEPNTLLLHFQFGENRPSPAKWVAGIAAPLSQAGPSTLLTVCLLFPAYNSFIWGGWVLSLLQGWEEPESLRWTKGAMPIYLNEWSVEGTMLKGGCGSDCGWGCSGYGDTHNVVSSAVPRLIWYLGIEAWTSKEGVNPTPPHSTPNST